MSNLRLCTKTEDSIPNSGEVFRLIDSSESLSVDGPDEVVNGEIFLFGVQRHISIGILGGFARLSDLVP